MRVPTWILAFALVTNPVSALLATPTKGTHKHHSKSKRDAQNDKMQLLSKSARAMAKKERDFRQNKADSMDKWMKIWGIPKEALNVASALKQNMASKSIGNVSKGVAIKAVGDESKGAYPPYGFGPVPYGWRKPNPIAPLATAVAVGALVDAVKPKTTVAPKPNVVSNEAAAVADAPTKKFSVAPASKYSVADPAPDAEMPEVKRTILAIPPPTIEPPRVRNDVDQTQKKMQELQWNNWWKNLPEWRQKELRLQMEWNYANNGHRGVEYAFPPPTTPAPFIAEVPETTPTSVAVFAPSPTTGAPQAPQESLEKIGKGVAAVVQPIVNIANHLRQPGTPPLDPLGDIWNAVHNGKEKIDEITRNLNGFNGVGQNPQEKPPSTPPSTPPTNPPPITASIPPASPPLPSQGVAIGPGVPTDYPHGA